jgi:isoprenylcysteine carboxyl methyltransferase (ICMT) family protein YpbQ
MDEINCIHIQARALFEFLEMFRYFLKDTLGSIWVWRLCLLPEVSKTSTSLMMLDFNQKQMMLFSQRS